MRHPPLRWSNKKEEITISVELRDVTDEKIAFRDNKFLDISCTSSGKHYKESIELFEEINGEVDSYLTGRNLSGRSQASPSVSLLPRRATTSGPD